MDYSAFKLDLDELLNVFSERELKSLADMKKLWLERKFSYIFEARPSASSNIFMQILYGHSIRYMISNSSLSQRLGALYVLYCLYETQPFKPPFKIYISLGELRRLRALVGNAKENGIREVSVLAKRMVEKNAFLFGFVNINDYSEKERIKELVDVQNACIKKMHEKLLENSEIERYLHMDMGMELDLEVLRKMSKEYEGAKSFAIREASRVVDVENIKHIAEDRLTVGDEVQKLNEQWGNQKEMFSQLIRAEQLPGISLPGRSERYHEQPLLLPAAEQQQSDNEWPDTSFMALLLGNGSPLANRNVQPGSSEQQLVTDGEELDYDLEFAKDLEDQLFGDML